MIPEGPFLMLIPLPSMPKKVSANWLESRLSRGELKTLAEKAGRKDALERAIRRKQL